MCVLSGNEELKKILDICGNNFPRNIVDICEKLGIEVQETKQFPDNICGIIFKENNKYIILVNKFHSIGRKSFTIAHELGHYFLHKELLDTNNELVSYTKSNGSKVPALARGIDYNKREAQANQFAADILMPEKEFLAKCECCDSIEEVAGYFAVSTQAASVRANNLGGWYFL